VEDFEAETWVGLDLNSLDFGEAAVAGRVRVTRGSQSEVVARLGLFDRFAPAADRSLPQTGRIQ
jgi:hypothetical protein